MYFWRYDRDTPGRQVTCENDSCFYNCFFCKYYVTFRWNYAASRTEKYPKLIITHIKCILRREES